MATSVLRSALRRVGPSVRLGVPTLRSVGPALASRSSSTVPTVTTSSGAVVPVDKYFDDESLVAHQARVRHDDPGNRTFNYTMIGGSRFLGASAARLLVVKFLAAMNPAADVLALASLEVDISNLEPGNCMIVKWRGKPVFIRSRTGTWALARRPHAQPQRSAPPPPAERERRIIAPHLLSLTDVCLAVPLTQMLRSRRRKRCR